MESAFLVQREITPAMVISASSEAGDFIDQPIPDSNVGDLTLESYDAGKGAITTQYGVKIQTGGDLGVATFQATVDGGTTWLGKLPETTLDDGAVGGAGTYRTIYTDASGHNVCASRPVQVDSDGDGIPDMVVVAINDNGTIKIYSTTDLTGAGSWTLRCANAGTMYDAEAAVPAMVAIPALTGSNILPLVVFYRPSTTGHIMHAISYNSGTTWEAGGEIAGGDDISGGVNAVVLPSGMVLVAYQAETGGGTKYNHVMVTSWSHGMWSGIPGVPQHHFLDVTPGTGTNYNEPTLMVDGDGKVIMLCKQVGTGIIGKQCSAKDPAAATASWTTYSGTLWGAASTHRQVACVTAPDGSMFAMVGDATSKNLSISTIAADGTTWDALTEVVDLAGELAYPRMGIVGGAIWAVYVDSTNSKILLGITKYWASIGSDESWTPLDDMLLMMPDQTWIRWGGSDGIAGDAWSWGMAKQYDKSLILSDSPSEEWRSVDDNENYSIVIDLGATGGRLAVDSVALMSNVEHLHFQMADSDSWGSPPVDESISFVRDTGTVFDVDGDCATLTGVPMVPKEEAALGTVLLPTSGTLSGTPVAIDDNDATRIWAHGVDLESDGLAHDDTVSLLSPMAYKQFTGGTHRFLRIYIPAQKTVEGYYRIRLFRCGQRLNPTTNYQQDVRHGLTSVNELIRYPSGRRFSATPGNDSPPQTWTYRFQEMPDADKRGLFALVQYAGLDSVPIVFVPEVVSSAATSFVFGFLTRFGPFQASAAGRWTGDIDIEEQR